jgi:hypothetical protein
MATKRMTEQEIDRVLGQLDLVHHFLWRDAAIAIRQLRTDRDQLLRQAAQRSLDVGQYNTGEA